MNQKEGGGIGATALEESTGPEPVQGDGQAVSSTDTSATTSSGAVAAVETCVSEEGETIQANQGIGLDISVKEEGEVSMEEVVSVVPVADVISGVVEESGAPKEHDGVQSVDHVDRKEEEDPSDKLSEGEIER